MSSTWRVSEALAHELDLAVSLTMSESLRPLFPTFRDAVQGLPDTWFALGRALLAGLEGDVFAVLGRLTTVLGRVEDTDYATLTLSLRETSVAEVVAAARALAEAADIDLCGVEDAPDTLFAVTDALEARAGTLLNPEGRRRLRLECRVALSACRDGAAHARFWYWLDQFQHEVYRAWRAGRADYLAAERARAAAALGGLEGEGIPPFEWLPPLSPVRSIGAVHERVASGALSVVFLVEPFGIWDVSAPLPGAILATFSLPGDLQRSFRARAEDIAGRLKALADPTRLTMLRIVRSAEVDNSDLAGHLELSHPTISVHAKLLRDAGLVERRREGRHLFHRVDVEGVRRLLREVESFLGVHADVRDDDDA